MANYVYRIHPAIGVGRVGNSEEFYLAPETMAGLPVPEDNVTTGGLPIRPGTESEHITSHDFRDANGGLKRQAPRFRVFQYPAAAKESYPNGQGTEIRIGSKIDGKIVKDIIWTVHLANKKTNTFVLTEDIGQPQGISSYIPPNLPPIRNASPLDPKAPQPADPVAVLNDPVRVRKLTIDPGPRTISGKSTPGVRFDQTTTASFFDIKAKSIVSLKNYPKSFPGDSFSQMEAPAGAIDTLGEIQTDEHGRLIVLGGYGRAAGWMIDGASPPLTQPVNNDRWFDDTSDGPVSAVLLLDDDSVAEVHGAWTTTTDPSFAPQILNVVSLWDDIYDAWVRQLGLAPKIYDAEHGGYQRSYKPTFDDQLLPIFRSAALQQWVVNLNPHARSAHAAVGKITAQTDPFSTPLAGVAAIFRDPDQDQFGNVRLMPLALGDANEGLLALRKTQFFFLRQWNLGRDHFSPGAGPALGPGESLDKATLVNCLGGRFSPGIDLTFVVREPDLYIKDWQTSGAGPFRVRPKPLDYSSVTAEKPLLTAGYIPRHTGNEGLEPGDLSKFMAIPWHTDYNSCATHLPSPNPRGNKTLFWSWPAQRPVAVFAASDVTWPQVQGQPPAQRLGDQRWSVRGPGTDSTKPQNWGRYQPPILQMVENWVRIGFVVQGSAIDTPGTPFDSDSYLEVGSQLIDTGQTPVIPFPNYDASAADERALFFQLMNVEDHPDVLPRAREFVNESLAWAEAFSNDAANSPADQLFFEFSEDAFRARLDLIYQELVDAADQSDPGANPLFKTRQDMITRIVQLAPFNLVDGAWLRNIGKTGPIDEVRALLYSISMDELGDGDVSQNHCNIYLDLCHSVGYYPPPLNSREFAFDPQFLQSAFTVPAFELAISQFSEDYYPELLGMTLQLEWEVVDLKPTRDLIEYFGLNPHFYIMHIGIDNAVNGHGQRAADAVRIYLENIRAVGGDSAARQAWRRIWNGFVAFGSLGTFGTDFQNLILNKPTLEDQMIAMIKRKAQYGSLNHQSHMVGPTRINEWFADPHGFLKALEVHRWITPGDWENSRMKELMNFETGPMYRVFTDDEIQLWADYTRSLAQPPPPVVPPGISPARAMAALIDQLRPIQRGTPGHQINAMADPQGESHSIAWWFEQPTRTIMEAIALPANGLVVPRNPGESRFYTQLIAPTGPMGSVFALPASPPNTGTCRDVVLKWIQSGCPLLETQHETLRLNSPLAVKERHRTGRIYGMGTVH
ncbi:MAG: LodA/GoxA family CTQ-dependent oxidase [Isosphaeraceae bacterium]|nr:LodA/GoxA family CTQ-dependent oxidase [Isosphaeraceae bacterium]